MNTAIYALRAFKAGLSMADLEEVEEGFVVDMITEEANDYADYDQVASQADMDRF